MQVQFYKPNKFSKGYAVSFTVPSENNCVFAQIIRQTGWNEKERKGSFKEGERKNIKFSPTEIGGLLRSIVNQVEVTYFHSTEESKTSITFKPIATKEGVKLHSFGVISGEDKYLVGFTEDEASYLAEFFRNFFRVFFEQTRDDLNARQAEYEKSKTVKEDKPAAKAKTAPKKETKKKVEETVEEDDTETKETAPEDDDLAF